jgi:hypothetical protein
VTGDKKDLLVIGTIDRLALATARRVLEILENAGWISD